MQQYVATGPFAPDLSFEVFGSTTTDLRQMDLLELGYRTKLGERVQLDIELFRSQLTNFSHFRVIRP